MMTLASPRRNSKNGLTICATSTSTGAVQSRYQLLVSTLTRLPSTLSISKLNPLKLKTYTFYDELHISLNIFKFNLYIVYILNMDFIP